MSLAFCVLGSGSGGNSTLVMCSGSQEATRAIGKPDSFCVLIDAGLSPRATAKRMASLGIAPCDIRAIVLTHLDSDHFHRSWLRLIHRHNIRVYVHRQHRNAAWRSDLNARCTLLYEGNIGIEPTANGQELAAFSLSISSCLQAHDDLGSVGLVLEHDGVRLGYATDLGCVCDSLVGHFQNLHAVAIESNYDRTMQVKSARPWFLKRRIMGGKGHLSNDQALEAVQRIAANSQLSHIVLLHLSQQCNCPKLVRDFWLAREPRLASLLTISHQRVPTELLAVSRGADAAIPCEQGHLDSAACLYGSQKEAEPSLFAAR